MNVLMRAQSPDVIEIADAFLLQDGLGHRHHLLHLGEEREGMKSESDCRGN